MLFFQRLFLTTISLLLFVSTTGLCLQGMYQPATIHVRAVWQNDGFTITWVRPSSNAWIDGIRPGARITSIDEHAPARSDSIATAQVIEALYDGKMHRTVAIPPILLITEYFPTAMTLAAWFAGTAHVYFMAARSRTWAWMVLVLCGSAAYAFATSIGTQGDSPLWAFDAVVLSILVFFSACLIFALGFPINRLGTLPGKRLALTSGITTGIIGFLYLVVVHTDQGRYESFRPVLLAIWLMNALGACLLAVRSFIWYRKTPPLIWPLIIIGAGMLLGILPFCLLVLLPNIIWGAPLFSPYLVSNSLIFVSLGVIVAAAHLELAYSEQQGADDLVAAAQHVKQETARGKKFPVRPPDDPPNQPPAS